MKSSVTVAISAWLLIITQQFVAAAYQTPTNGKYFFSQMDYNRSQSFTKLGIEAQTNQELNLHLNTEELTLAVFTKNCSVAQAGAICNVPDPFDPSIYQNRSGWNITYETGHLFVQPEGNFGQIARVQMSGYETSQKLNVTVPSFLRQFTYNGYMFEVIQVNQEYSSNYVSGFIGIGPYTAIDGQDATSQRVQYSENFLYQLKEQGHIDNQIVSIYMSKKYENGNDQWYGVQKNDTESFVKFGSYDPEGFQNASEISIVNTNHADSWVFTLGQIKFISGTIDHKYLSAQAIIEPAYPFIYLPKVYWQGFRYLMQNKNVFTNLEIHQEYMFFRSPCNQVQNPFSTPIGIKFDGPELFFNMSDLLVPSEEVTITELNHCYIGVFPNTIQGSVVKDENLIYFGQLYLRKFYTFFDISGYQSDQTSTLVIGTGYKNENARILETHYNQYSENYEKESGDQSTWTYLPNQFTDETVPDDKPVQPDVQPDGKPSEDKQSNTQATNDSEEEGGGMMLIIIIVVVAIFTLVSVGMIYYCKCRKTAVKGEEQGGEENLLKTPLDNTNIQNMDNSQSLDDSSDLTPKDI